MCTSAQAHADSQHSIGRFQLSTAIAAGRFWPPDRCGPARSAATARTAHFGIVQGARDRRLGRCGLVAQRGQGEEHFTAHVGVFVFERRGQCSADRARLRTDARHQRGRASAGMRVLECFDQGRRRRVAQRSQRTQSFVDHRRVLIGKQAGRARRRESKALAANRRGPAARPLGTRGCFCSLIATMSNEMAWLRTASFVGSMRASAQALTVRNNSSWPCSACRNASTAEDAGGPMRPNASAAPSCTPESGSERYGSDRPTASAASGPMRASAIKTSRRTAGRSSFRARASAPTADLASVPARPTPGPPNSATWASPAAALKTSIAAEPNSVKPLSAVMRTDGSGSSRALDSAVITACGSVLTLGKAMIAMRRT